MTDLFWPGDERAGRLMSDAALLEAMVRVEAAWLRALVEAGIAPAGCDDDLTTRLTSGDVESIALGAEAAGNPVLALLDLLRSRVSADTASWLHRGLTSQDVVDTALGLTLRDVLDRLLTEVRLQVVAVSNIAEQHVASPMIGRTLTQHAVPTTFGAVAASWLDGIIDAAELLVVARTLLPAQIGGAVGTLAAPAELARLRGLPDAPAVAERLSSRVAETLGLRAGRPWHTSRGPLTRTADAIVSATDACGHLATDVATLSRTEIGELSESSGPGRGGSSTMPHKHNPVLSILIRRAAMTTPALAATVHLAAAMSGDQRPDGVWHAEWAALRDLGRRAVVATSQTTELVQGLDVDTDRMHQTLNASADAVLAERRGLADLFGTTVDNDPLTYLGTAAELVAGAVERAAAFVEGTA